MKICFYTENYYKGGLDTFLINLFNAWPDSKDELTLVCNGTHPGLDTIQSKALRPINIKKYYRVFTSSLAQGRTVLKWVPFFPIHLILSLAFRLMQYPILFPWYVFTLMLFFRLNNYDRLIVVNGGYPASLLVRCASIAWRFAGKKPLAVMNFHNSTTSPPWYYSIPENFIDKMVVNSVSHVVSVSQNCLSTLSKRSSFLKCDKLSYIYNGIEDSALGLKTNETSNKDISSNRYCLMLGTYETRKGHAYLLKAFQLVIKNFPDVHLQIYGHGQPNEKKVVADEVNRLNLNDNVKLCDFTHHTTQLIANASVLVVPSQAYESFGLTIIEAMAFGIPVVTTDVGGMPEVLGASDAGFVCSKNDPLAFANAIEKILGNSALAQELGRNGRKAFEDKFTADKMAINYRSLLL